MHPRSGEYDCGMATQRARSRSIADSDEITIDTQRWNEEDAAESLESDAAPDTAALVVFSRDWTIETITSQIRLGNIDLDPDFQRRNAWRDERRSALIESFILNFPVPQVVLAENPRHPKKYIVIDGKQRLLTIAGFFVPETRSYWTSPRFTGLKILKELNRTPIDEFLGNPQFEKYRTQLLNADLRTTIISGFKNENVLYDIFYRLNTGSVPLSSQELRQVLNRGDFSKHLLEATDKENPLWSALNQTGPDARLRDVELLLRLIAVRLFWTRYQGNMKPFLDLTMSELNTHWTSKADQIKSLSTDIFSATEVAQSIFGHELARKFKNERYEGALNRALFETQVFHFLDRKVRSAAKRKGSAIKTAFEKLSRDDPEFLSSIEATTKSIENYKIRFSRYNLMLASVLKMSVPSL